MRIFLWIATALTIGSVVLFFIFYTLTARTLYAQTDREIHLHASAITRAVSQEATMLVATVFENSPGMLVVVGNIGGEIIAGTILGTDSKEELSDLIVRSAGLINPTFVNKQVGTNSIRIGIFPVSGANRTEAIVLVGHPTEVIDHALSRLAYILILVLGALILLALLVSWLLSRSIMAPVVQLTDKLEGVSEANLTVEVQQLETKDELGRLTYAFTHMMERLRASFERERQFIGEVAHELKTPLSVAKSKLELSMADREAILAVDRVSDTLNNMLDLAWASAEQPLTDKDTVRLDLLTQEAVEVAVALGMKKRISVTAEIEPEVTVVGKKEKLFRVLLNILDNAVKYSNRDGKIKVKLTKENGVAKLEVSNTGKGIADEDLPYIFDRYYRGKGAGKKKGSGLGLAIVKRIVEAHGGEVRIFTNHLNLIVVEVIMNMAISAGE
jgi:signal transduction histidine kinase